MAGSCRHHRVPPCTLANLSAWPDAKVEALTRVLKGQPAAAALEGAFEITRNLPHGHVAAVLCTLRELGLEELLGPVPSRQRDLVTAMAVAQVIEPNSELAIARGLRAKTATSSLDQVLGVAGCGEDALALRDCWPWHARRRQASQDLNMSCSRSRPGSRKAVRQPPSAGTRQDVGRPADRPAHGPELCPDLFPERPD